MRYRPELDGLRALAVLAVFASHTGYQFVGPGYLGVNVFFVLSGYLITSLLLAEREQHGQVDYKAFYARRGLRLYPALVAACVMVAIFGVIVTVQSTGHAVLEIGAALLYVNDFIVAAHTHLEGAWLGHTWSLGVEEQFYLIWPATLMLLVRRGKLKREIVGLTVGLAVVPVVGALLLTGTAVQYSPLGAAFQLAAGALLAVMPFRAPRWSWVLVIGGYAFVWLVSPNPRSVGLQCGPMQLFTITALILVAWAITHSSQLLASKPLVWLGRRSYGFYLFHLPLLILIMHKVSSRSKGVALAFVASLVVTAMSYQLIELPFLRLKHRFERS